MEGRLSVGPRLVLAAAGAHIACVVLLGVLRIAGFGYPLRVAGPAVLLAFSVLGYGIALILSRQIAGEYANSAPMRLAWLAFAADSVLWIFGHIASNSLLYTFVVDKPVSGLLMHAAVVPADLCLLIGILSMWVGFHRAGLGFRVHWVDVVWMVLIVSAMAGILTFRGQLTEAASPYPGVHALQQAGLSLVALAAAASLVQRRFAQELGHGRLALALQFVAAHALGRCLLVLVEAVVRSQGPPPPEFQIFAGACRAAAHWSIAVAAAYLAAIPVHAAQQIRHLKRRQGMAPGARPVST
ncbi:MAG: hypothetical protein SGI92_18595 [Bryobacteraceae bacterium]|nr:hypothetical protein [Bryobacteraceae bacterium]